MDNNTNRNTKKQSNKNKLDTTIHKDSALRQLDTLMLGYINDPVLISNADKLAYWLEDYSRLLGLEKTFNPLLLKKYERGDVIKVNLGYNIGNEEGGLHYCIVLDKHNAMSSGILTVIPLTSDKGKKLHFSQVNLGNEIFIKFNEKFNRLSLELSNQINTISSSGKMELDKIEKATEDLKLLIKIKNELSKMKTGSIAMISQITTISKQRIYDPQKTGDILSGIRISEESLDLINEKVKQLYIK